MRAVLYYLYSEYIVFAPITSHYRHSSTTNGLKGAKARESHIKAYLTANPAFPAPVSPKAVYALAHKYELGPLKASIPAARARAFNQRIPPNPFLSQTIALERLRLDLTVSNILQELFSTFARPFSDPRSMMIKFTIAHWGKLRETKQWNDLVKKSRSKP